MKENARAAPLFRKSALLAKKQLRTAKGAEEKTKLQILYMEGKMRNMGVGKDNALLCHNPYTPEKTVIDLTALQKVA